MMQLREAAEALGVHYQTAYAWVRDGTLPARKYEREYDISAADVQALLAKRGLGRIPVRQIAVRDWPAQAARLYSAIIDGRETQARREIGRLAGHVTGTDLCDSVIAPALRQIGDGWAAGRISIAREHRATAICERLIAVSAGQPAGRPRGVAVVATPPGERHGMPALMAATCLRENRWLVHHLAADLPVTEISLLARQVDASLVVLSTATTASQPRAEDAERLIKAASPGIDVLIGRSGDTLRDLERLVGSRTQRGQA